MPPSAGGNFRARHKYFRANVRPKCCVSVVSAFFAAEICEEKYSISALAA
jgi:hypothetical protein